MIAALVLALAVCLGDDLKDLEAKLASSDARERRSAVQGLAKLGSPEAWKRVIGALDDPSSQVADEAQLAIAAIADPKVFEVLSGKDGLASRDEWVRVRVAEALGRMQTLPEVEPVLGALADKDAAVRRAACWSIERLRAADRWPQKAPAQLAAVARKDKDVRVRAAALLAWSSFGAEGGLAEECRLVSADSRFELRSASLLATAKLGDASKFAEALASDPHVGVRLCVAEHFASQRTAAGARRLVDMLEAETQLRARWRIVEMLRELSGLAHRLDPRPWRDWAAKLADGPLAKVEKPERPDDDRTVAFAGVPILSEHVCFLIDLSGSVWQAGKDGRTKKDAIDEKLANALRALPANVEFNVIPYTGTPIPWENALRPAEPKNVQKALEFFVGRKDTGTGNFWDALQLALADPKTDSIVVLTDGAPTGGRRWNLGLMVKLFEEDNRLRRVVLDAVLAGAPERLRKDWTAMCASSGGRVVEIDLR